MNTIGLSAALGVFLGVWLGHVAVRKIEALSPSLWPPSLGFTLVGLFCEWLALSTFNLQISTFFGILGITLLWDALETPRQARRVKQGHAPANPRNPRHAALLAAPGSHATTVDLLKRDVGRN